MFCALLMSAKISGERLQDHWSSGLRGLLHFLNAYTGHIFLTRQYRTILIDFNDFSYQNDLGKT